MYHITWITSRTGSTESCVGGTFRRRFRRIALQEGAGDTDQAELYPTLLEQLCVTLEHVQDNVRVSCSGGDIVLARQFRVSGTAKSDGLLDQPDPDIHISTCSAKSTWTLSS